MIDHSAGPWQAEVDAWAPHWQAKRQKERDLEELGRALRTAFARIIDPAIALCTAAARWLHL